MGCIGLGERGSIIFAKNASVHPSPEGQKRTLFCSFRAPNESTCSEKYLFRSGNSASWQLQVINFHTISLGNLKYFYRGK